jgi:alpha-tubulin suppressor-like RCC1 family protein
LDGTVAAWGRNYRGEVGDGSTVTTRPTPKTVAGISGAISIGTGRDHCLVVLSDHTMRSWGYNVGGQLGDNTTATRRTPVTVSGVTGALEAEGGGDYSIAMLG